MADVLHPQVDFLGHDASLDPLVDEDTHSALGDVVDSASLSVVHLVGHTFGDSTATLDVDDISVLVDLHVG